MTIATVTDSIAMPYPSSPAARNRWILERRPARNVLDPWRPYAFLAETETGPDGEPPSRSPRSS